MRNPQLKALKTLKQADVRKAFDSVCLADVSIDGIIWNGGFDSAIKLDAAKRLAESAGLTKVTFFDASKTPHILTIEEAMGVIIGVSVDYQTKLAKKQELMKAIEDATAVEEVELISWLNNA